MQTDRFYLEIALNEAEQASQEGTFPTGALIVGPDGMILGRGRNRVYSTGDYTSHAEVNALRTAGKILMEPSYAGKCIAYTTIEPCLMCAGALLIANIARVVWVVNDSDFGALSTQYQGGLYPVLFASLRLTAISEPAIAERIQILMRQWDATQQANGWV